MTHTNATGEVAGDDDADDKSTFEGKEKHKRMLGALCEDLHDVNGENT